VATVKLEGSNSSDNSNSSKGADETGVSLDASYVANDYEVVRPRWWVHRLTRRRQYLKRLK
jgi:hypothetical protein